MVNGASYFILAVYRPPINNATDINAFISCVDGCLDKCLRRNEQAVFVGDFNMDFSVQDHSTRGLVELMSSYALETQYRVSLVNRVVHCL